MNDARRIRSVQDAFVAFVPALIASAFVAFAPSMVLDGDAYWHIAAGEWMLETGSVPQSDPFSYTFAGAPWNAHEWLSEVIMAAAHRAAGWSGIYVLFAGVVCAIGILTARALLKYLSPIPAFVILQLVLINLVEDMQARPQVLVLPILVLWLDELMTALSEERQPRWKLLVPLMVLWVNLHGSFVLGLALLAALTPEAVLNAGPHWARTARDWATVCAAAIASALITPTGVAGLIFPFELMAMQSTSLIFEWRSVDFSRVSVFELSLLGTIFFCLFRGVRVPPVRLLLLIGMLHMALQHQRLTVILVVAGSIILAEPIAKTMAVRAAPVCARTVWTSSALSACVLLLFTSIAAIRVTLPKSLGDDFQTPITALGAVPDAVARQPVLNQYEYGGYLIYKGLRPFIDGRADMYGDAFVFDYQRLIGGDRPTLTTAITKHNIVWAIFRPGSGANSILDTLTDWCTVYSDRYAVVHVQKDVVSRAGLRCAPDPPAAVAH